MIEDFIGIFIVGAALSVAIQILKDKLGTTSYATKVLTIVLSLIVGGIYVALRDTVYYATVIGVLTSASTVYALVLKESK